MDELSPFLRNLKDKNGGFKVPEGYFDKLEDSVFQKINEQGARKKPLYATRGGLFHRLIHSRTTYAAAAAAIALMLAAWWFLRPATPALYMAQTDLTEEELQIYIAENVLEFEIDQLAMLQPEERAVDSPDIPETMPTDSQKQHRVSPAKLFHPEDVKDLLNDMSEEELEEIL